MWYNLHAREQHQRAGERQRVNTNRRYGYPLLRCSIYSPPPHNPELVCTYSFVLRSLTHRLLCSN